MSAFNDDVVLSVKVGLLSNWLIKLEKGQNPPIGFSEDHQKNFEAAYRLRGEIIAQVRQELEHLLTPF